MVKLNTENLMQPNLIQILSGGKIWAKILMCIFAIIINEIWLVLSKLFSCMKSHKPYQVCRAALAGIAGF